MYLYIYIYIYTRVQKKLRKISKTSTSSNYNYEMEGFVFSFIQKVENISESRGNEKFKQDNILRNKNARKFLFIQAISISNFYLEG